MNFDVCPVCHKAWEQSALLATGACCGFSYSARADRKFIWKQLSSDYVLYWYNETKDRKAFCWLVLPGIRNVDLPLLPFDITSEQLEKLLLIV